MRSWTTLALTLVLVPACAFELDNGDNKLLGAVLSHIRLEQLARDEAKLRNARTRRERRLLEKRLAGAHARGLTGHF